MSEEILSTPSFWFYIYNTIMNVTDYWPMAREYSISNTTVAALQFWTADLEALVLSSTIEQVYNAFFYSTSTHLLCQQWDEVLFSHFVTTLNAAFKSKLTLEDEGYESSSENFNIPTPLRRTFKIHHVSSDENISFNPVTPCSTDTIQSHHKPVWCHLTFISPDDEDTLPVKNSLPSSVAPLQTPHSKYTLPICDDIDDDKEEENFSNHFFRGWSLEYGRNFRLTFMYTWTFNTTWTLSIPMPIFEFHIFIILQNLGQNAILF